MLAAPRPGAEEALVTVHEPARLSFTATSRTTFVTHQFYILITNLIAAVLDFSPLLLQVSPAFICPPLMWGK